MDEATEKVSELYLWRKRHLSFPGLVFISLATLYFLPSLLMPVVWYDLKSITPIVDGVPNSDVVLQVERVIHRDFEGSYEVAVYDANTDAFICQTESKNSFPYKTGRPIIDRTLPPELQAPGRVSLQWWLGGEAAMTQCESLGLTGDVDVRVFTCHAVHSKVYDLPIAQRCMYSDIVRLRNGFDSADYY